MRSEPDAYLKGLPVRIQDYTFADVGQGLADFGGNGRIPLGIKLGPRPLILAGIIEIGLGTDVRRQGISGRTGDCPAADNLLGLCGDYSFLVVGVLVVESFYFAHFDRVIVFVQFRVDQNMMPLMLSYQFRVLHAVAGFVLVIFHHVIVAIFSNVASYGRFSNAV
jgi:hypothetical protein